MFTTTSSISYQILLLDYANTVSFLYPLSNGKNELLKINYKYQYLRTVNRFVEGVSHELIMGKETSIASGNPHSEHKGPPLGHRCRRARSIHPMWHNFTARCALLVFALRMLYIVWREGHVNICLSSKNLHTKINLCTMNLRIPTHCP